MKKEVYIHFGPPKTGTSAVQKWFVENENFLRAHRICYPQHDIDTNGVSSGNVRSLYDINSEKKVILNPRKIESLLSAFERSESTILFLSSEFFFRGIVELKKAIPSAKFIGYVRNPMEIKESSYNQSVKRHFQKKPITTGVSKKLPYLDRFVNFKNEFGCDDLEIRLYGEAYFQGGNIVTDLLSFMGIEADVSLNNVNNSYHLEALEFKRWLNQFELQHHQVLVDRALQSYSDGTRLYSLVPNDQYIENCQHYAKVIQSYADELDTDKLNPLIDDMLNVIPKPYFSQTLTDDEFLGMCKFLQNKMQLDYSRLQNDVRNFKGSEDNDTFVTLFLNSYTTKYKAKFAVLIIVSKLRGLLFSYINKCARVFKR